MSAGPQAGPRYLLDTHIWLWQASASPRLPPSLRDVLEDPPDGELWLSPVSIWELGLLVENGRIELTTGVREWTEEAIGALSLREAPLTREVALVSHELELPHRDPADRFLAATALVYELMLITADQRLLDTEWLPTL